MKLQWITGILMVGALTISSIAQVDHKQSLSNGNPIATGPFDTRADNSESLITSRDTLDGYEKQMALVTIQTYSELAQIAQAFREGRISSEQGQYLARHQYEFGIIRLQFLDTLHETLEANTSKQDQPAKQEEPTSNVKVVQQMLVVAPPTSSADVPEAMVRYLALTPVQIAAIQARATALHKQVQPLLEQLARNQKALAVATQDTRFNNNRIRKLASEQSHILKQLIIADSHLQRDIHEILTPAQREQFQEMRQTAAVQSPQVLQGLQESTGQVVAGMHQ